MKIFYGWRIVGAGGALQFLQSLLLNQAFGAYVAALVDERGWSKTSIAGAAALKSTETAVLGPVLGWMVDRFGAKGIVRAGIVLFGIGFMLLSWIDTLAGFYGAFVVIALGSALCSNFPVSVAIIQWFEKRRARALSALQFGSALGGIFVFVVAWSIQHYGWRVTAFASGVIAIVVGWPLARIIRSRPEDVGETVDGLPPATKGTSHAAVAPPRAFSAREALRTKAFWLISLGHGFALFAVTAVNVHAITHVKEGLGYTLAQASLVITVVTVGTVHRRDLGLGARRPVRKALRCGGLHAHACRRAADAHLRHRSGHPRHLGARARNGLGVARPVHAGDARRLLRAHLDRHDHRALFPHHRDRADRRPDTGGTFRRLDR
jgi:sugar phosphate permease